MSVGNSIYPGRFDPVTLGHMDVIERACLMFARVTVAVAASEAKNPLFSAEERAEMIRQALPAGINAVVKTFDNLLVDFVRREQAGVVIRGLRAVSDFEFEFQMALMNRRLDPGLETVFLTPKEDYTFLSSRIVKEVARLGGDVSAFVPASVADRLRSRVAKP